MTEKEKELINQLGEKHFINDIAYSILKNTLEQRQQIDFDDILASMDKEQMHDA